MQDIKLNKNQRRFFEKAINYFGEKSKNLRLKEINKFAKTYNLIVPTSALKKYCHNDSLKRGFYNLTLIGISLPETPSKQIQENPSQEFNSQNIILDISTFAK